MRTPKDFWLEMSIREISTQSHFALIAHKNIDVKAANAGDVVFSSIHSFLSHCALVSKMLKADDGGVPPIAIGDVLRIQETSIVHNKRFRNHLEHYDERLQKWIADRGTNLMIATYNIGPKRAFQVPGMLFVSHYDPTTDVFTFVDEDFPLGDLKREVTRIGSLANQWVRDAETGKIAPPFA